MVAPYVTPEELEDTAIERDNAIRQLDHFNQIHDGEATTRISARSEIQRQDGATAKLAGVKLAVTRIIVA